MISTCMPQQSAWPILGASEAEKYHTHPQVAITMDSKHLTLKDVSIQDNTIILQLKQSKTDQLGKGSKIVIGQSKQAICPVKITRRFLQYRQQANHSDALFRLKDGALLTRQRLQSVLRKSLTMLNLPAKHFGTHSLRIGSATAAAQACRCSSEDN